MTRRRAPEPLTLKNASGNGVPATADLVTVQGFLNASVAAMGDVLGGRIERLEERLRDEIRRGQEAHDEQHRQLLGNLEAWKQAQEERAKQQEDNCAERMAPFENVDRVLAVLSWIANHRKAAAGAITFSLGVLVSVAVLIGGYYRAP